uniref:Uncharacterized protein n=1 Tax=Anguilla anguilla TaxID=7936 RepID=A0A0E9W5E2_ANGAN
MGVNWVRMRGK